MIPAATLVSSLRYRIRAAALGAAFFAAAACGGDDPVRPNANGLEALPLTAATVTAAVELATRSPMAVHPYCFQTVEINCIGGPTDAPLSLVVVRGPIVVEKLGTETFSFATNLTVTSVQNIPVSSSGVTCSAVVNTAAGTSTTVRFAGIASFSRWSQEPDIDVLSLASEITGFESEDVTLTGSSICAAASSLQSLAVGSFDDALAGDITLCGAAGPALFGPCPSIPRDKRTRR